MVAVKEVSFEVVTKAEDGRRSMFDKDTFPSLTNLDSFRPPMDRNVEVARKLQKRRIDVHHIGDFSISASCSVRRFERFFKTKISEIKLPPESRAPKGYRMFAPRKGAPWKLPKRDGLDEMIDSTYIQHPPILFAGERPIPPRWTDKFRLRIPVDVAQIMGASKVHRRGLTGRGVRVAMPDTGFYRHPYFIEQGYNFLAVTAPDVLDHTTDKNGHGTGECANLLATAPGINFIGVKFGNPTLAFKTAVELRPDFITNSWGYSLDLPRT
ncbi:MAG: serine protease, partial [Methanobacteriota archaeon]